MHVCYNTSGTYPPVVVEPQLNRLCLPPQLDGLSHIDSTVITTDSAWQFFCGVGCCEPLFFMLWYVRMNCMYGYNVRVYALLYCRYLRPLLWPVPRSGHAMMVPGVEPQAGHVYTLCLSQTVWLTARYGARGSKECFFTPGRQMSCYAVCALCVAATRTA